MGCIAINELIDEYKISKDELQILTTDMGMFVSWNDNEICEMVDDLIKRIKEYVRLREEIRNNELVLMDGSYAKIFSLVGYTVIRYNEKTFVTDKYKPVQRTDLKYLVDKKDRSSVKVMGNKYLVPNDVFQKIEEKKKEEQKRNVVFTIDIDDD